MWKICTERQRCRRKPSKKSNEVEKSHLDNELNFSAPTVTYKAENPKKIHRV